MSLEEVTAVLQDMMLTTLTVAAPSLAAALVVGLTIAAFQPDTQITDKTLTFVPKLAAIIVVFWGSMNFMTQTLVSFFHERIIPIIAGG